MQSDLGLTPNNDGKVIRLQVPQLTAVRPRTGGAARGQAGALGTAMPLSLPTVYSVRLLSALLYPLPAPPTRTCPPPRTPSQERRKEMAKVVSKLGEEGKVAIRNVRRDAMKAAEKLEKDGGISGGQGLGDRGACVRGCDAVVCSECGVAPPPPPPPPIGWPPHPSAALLPPPALPQRTSARTWRRRCRS